MACSEQESVEAPVCDGANQQCAYGNDNGLLSEI